MKLLIVAMDNSPFSSRSHEIRVAEEFARHGHAVHLVTERQPRWTHDDPQPDNLICQVAPVNDPRQAEAIAKALSPDFDAGYATSASGSPILAAWKGRAGKPVVTQALDVPLWRLRWKDQGPWYASWRPWFTGLLAMNRVIVNTKQTWTDLLGAATLYDTPHDVVPATEVVYYGIDTDTADKAPPFEYQDAVKPLIAGKTTCVGVSRLVPYKGFDLAIAALALLEDAPVYTIIGAGEDMDRLLNLGQLTDTSLIMTGGVNDLDKFSIIKSNDFGLQLAYNQNIPLQFPIEAAYCGLPVICADTPINRERFTDDYPRTFKYVNPFDTREVSELVELLAGTGPITEPRWPEETARVREWIQRERSFKSHARETLRILESLL